MRILDVPSFPEPITYLRNDGSMMVLLLFPSSSCSDKCRFVFKTNSTKSPRHALSRTPPPGSLAFLLHGREHRGENPTIPDSTSYRQRNEAASASAQKSPTLALLPKLLFLNRATTAQNKPANASATNVHRKTTAIRLLRDSTVNGGRSPAGLLRTLRG